MREQNNLSRVFCIILSLFVAMAFWSLLQLDSHTIYGGVENQHYFALLCVALYAIPVFFILLLMKRRVSGITAGDVFALLFCLYILGHSFVTGSHESREAALAGSYFILYWLFRRAAQLKLTRYISVVVMSAGIWEALLVLEQLWGNGVSQHHQFVVTGSFFNPGPCGIFLAGPFVLAIVYIKRGIRRVRFDFLMIRYVLSYAAAMLIAVAMIPTMSRAGWIGAVVGCLALYRKDIFRRLQSASSCRLLKWGGLVFLLLLFIACIYLFKKDSANGRLLIWKNTLAVTVDAPFLGVGIDGFGGSYAQSQHDHFLSQESLTQDSPEIDVVGVPNAVFNEPLALLLLTGVIGVLLAVITIVLKFRKTNDYTFVVLSLLIASLFSYPFYIPAIGMLFIISFAQLPEKKMHLKITSKTGYFIIFPLILSLAMVYCGVICGNECRKKEAYQKWKKNSPYYSQKDYEEVVAEYTELIPNLRNDYNFLFEYGHALYKVGRYMESNQYMLQGAKKSCDPMFWNIIGSNYGAMEQDSKAEECFLRAYYICPNRIYPLFLLVKLFEQTERWEECRFYGELLLAKKIKVQSPATEEMQREVRDIIQNIKVNNLLCR